MVDIQKQPRRSCVVTVPVFKRAAVEKMQNAKCKNITAFGSICIHQSRIQLLTVSQGEKPAFPIFTGKYLLARSSSEITEKMVTGQTEKKQQKLHKNTFPYPKHSTELHLAHKTLTA